MSKFTDELLAAAAAEVGVQEIGQSNRGPRVDIYQRSTGWSMSDWGSWCAAFACFVIQQALIKSGTKETAHFKRPMTARAFDFEKWSLAQDGSTSTRKPPSGDIIAADVVIFTFSHIGFANGRPNGMGMFPTYEGNTNAKGSRTGGMVCEGSRHISEVRSRIRFTI